MLDPKARVAVEVDGVTLYVRPLTERRKQRMAAHLMDVYRSLNLNTPEEVRQSQQAGFETMDALLRECLVGWEGKEAKFSRTDMEANLDELTADEFIAVFKKAEAISKLSEGDEKNLPASSASPAPARDSTAVEKTHA